jgi:hypothetical protein
MMLRDSDWHEADGSWRIDDVVAYECRVGESRLVIASTPASRYVASNPQIVGETYVGHVTSATRTAMSWLFADGDGGVTGTRPHPLIILRGGATFAPTAGLEAIGFGPGPTSFVTSESSRPPGAVPTSSRRYSHFQAMRDARDLIVCDIVASGETVVGAVQEALSVQPAIERITVVGFLTMNGAERIVSALGDVVEVTCFAFEALFGLPSMKDAARPLTSPCDFLRTDFISTGRYIDLLAAQPSLVLEQCMIYDGGDRAFDPEAHRATRGRYWSGLAQMSRSGREAEAVFRSGDLLRSSTRSRIIGATEGTQDRIIMGFDQLMDAPSSYFASACEP